MLKVLRLLENTFYSIGSYFEDCADGLDTEFHDELRRALAEPTTGELSLLSGCNPELHQHIWPGWVADLSQEQLCMCGEMQWGEN